MALEKTGYTAAIQGTTKVSVAVDDNGYIAPSGTTPAGKKTFTLKQVSADNSLADNTEVLNFFIGLVDGVSDSTTNVMSVSWNV